MLAEEADGERLKQRGDSLLIYLFFHSQLPTPLATISLLLSVSMGLFPFGLFID